MPEHRHRIHPGGVTAAVVLLSSVVLGFGWANAAETASGAVPRITLPEAVKRALARNPTVAVAAAEIERADGLLRQARSGMIPTLTGNGLYTRLDSDRVVKVKDVNGNVIGTTLTAPINQLSGNLTLNLPLLAPQAWYQTWRAGDNRRSAELGAVDVQRQIAVAVARAYLAIVAQHRAVAVNETARAAAKAHYDYAATRLRGGIGRAIDEVRAGQELATVEVAVQAALAGLARVREALGVLLAADGPLDVTDTVDLGTPPDLGAALGEAPTHRADIKALNQRLAAAQAQSGRMWTYYMPFLTAVAQPALVVGADFHLTGRWQALMILSLPIYDGGLRGGVARENDALVEQARANVEGTLRQAQSEVRTAFEAILRADKGLEAARDAARLAQRAFELATIAYQAGATTNLEVIDAARRARDAETSAAQTEDLARQSRLDLLVASGRFP
jgi:outer membrane protein TolC